MNKSETMQTENAQERECIHCHDSGEILRFACAKNPKGWYHEFEPAAPPADKDAIISRQAEQISQMTALLRDYVSTCLNCGATKDDHVIPCPMCIKADALLPKESL